MKPLMIPEKDIKVDATGTALISDDEHGTYFHQFFEVTGSEIHHKNDCFIENKICPVKSKSTQRHIPAGVKFFQKTMKCDDDDGIIQEFLIEIAMLQRLQANTHNFPKLYYIWVWGFHKYSMIIEAGDCTFFDYAFSSEREKRIIQARRFTMDVLEGLDYMHSHGMIHGDVKMTNIVLFGDKWKLIDFDRSYCLKGYTKSGGYGRNGEQYGTHGYRDLEKMLDCKELTDGFCTDIFALVICLLQKIKSKYELQSFDPNDDYCKIKALIKIFGPVDFSKFHHKDKLDSHLINGIEKFQSRYVWRDPTPDFLEFFGKKLTKFIFKAGTHYRSERITAKKGLELLSSK